MPVQRVIASLGAFVMLEPYTVKVVRTVLREEWGREAPDLPGGEGRPVGRTGN